MRQFVAIFFAFLLNMICNSRLPAQNNIASHHFQPAPAPVKFIHFEGGVEKNKVLLNWAVENNQDADQFIVERSADGKNFTMAALVFATEKNDTSHYRFFEKKKEAGMSYRIKALNKNGTINYSAVIIAKSIKSTGKITEIFFEG